MAIEFLGDILTPSIQLGELPGNGTETITLKSPDDLTSGSSTYTLPLTYPAVSGYVLSSLTDGTMSWAVGGGGGTNIGTSDLTITDTNRTLTIAVGGDFIIYDGNGTTDLQKWAHNNSTIWTSLSIASHGGVSGKIQFIESLTSGGAESISLKAPDSVTTSVVYTLPVAPTGSDKYLTSTTGGDMSWTDSSKDYKNTIVSNSVNLVAKNTTFTVGEWKLRGSLNHSWTYDTWSSYAGTYSPASGWPIEEVTMAGVKIGSLSKAGTNINLSATITARTSAIGNAGAISGRIYVWQYNCATIAADADNHTSVPLQEDFVAYSIADTGSAQGTCVSLDFTRAIGMGIGDYYVVGVSCTTSNLQQNDPVWFNYNITQVEVIF